MRTIPPALERFISELHDDFENLDQWTERTVTLLHQQNLLIDQREIAYTQAMEAQQKLILDNLQIFAVFEKNGLEIRSGIPPKLAILFLHKHHSIQNGKKAEKASHLLFGATVSKMQELLGVR
jgi:hypothetical protein